MIFIVDVIIFCLAYVGAATINLEKIFFTHFASIVTIISQYIIPLVLLVGYMVKNKKDKRENIKVVKNEKVKNNI